MNLSDIGGMMVSMAGFAWDTEQGIPALCILDLIKLKY